MNEEEMAAALEGKFFRGPSTFHQSGFYYSDELDELVPKKKLVEVKKKQRQEILEREAEAAPTKWRIPVNLIIEACSVAHGFSLKDMRQHDIVGTKRAPLVVCRQHASWLIKRLRKDYPLTQIAEKLNYKDHSTVIYGIKRFEKVQRTYVPEIELALEYLRNQTGDQTICIPSE